jgi:hypothetical protein
LEGSVSDSYALADVEVGVWAEIDLSCQQGLNGFYLLSRNGCGFMIRPYEANYASCLKNKQSHVAGVGYPNKNVTGEKRKFDFFFSIAPGPHFRAQGEKGLNIT